MTEFVNVVGSLHGDASARRAGPVDADELARLRWIWRAGERNEVGDPDRFREEFGTWISKHERTHVPISWKWEAAPSGWLGSP